MVFAIQPPPGPLLTKEGEEEKVYKQTEHLFTQRIDACYKTFFPH